MDVGAELAAGAQAIRNSNVSVALLRQYMLQVLKLICVSVHFQCAAFICGASHSTITIPLDMFQLQGPLGTYGTG